MKLYEHLPKEMNEWKKVAEDTRFFGLPISEMSRDELLAIIGHLVQDRDRTSKRHVQEREFLFDLRSLKPWC